MNTWSHLGNNMRSKLRRSKRTRDYAAAKPRIKHQQQQDFLNNTQERKGVQIKNLFWLHNQIDAASTFESIMGNCYFDYCLGAFPEFRDENSFNPLEFIENVEICFSDKLLDFSFMIKVMFILLKSKAKYWFRSRTFQNFHQFKKEFLTEFCNESIKIKLKHEWQNDKFYKSRDINLQTFYYKKLYQARFIRPEMSSPETNVYIIKMLPYNIQKHLVTINYDKNDEISKVLNNLDLIYLERIQKYYNKCDTRSKAHSVKPQIQSSINSVFETKYSSDYKNKKLGKNKSRFFIKNNNYHSIKSSLLYKKAYFQTSGESINIKNTKYIHKFCNNRITSEKKFNRKNTKSSQNEKYIQAALNGEKDCSKTNKLVENFKFSKVVKKTSVQSQINNNKIGITKQTVKNDTKSKVDMSKKINKNQFKLDSKTKLKMHTKKRNNKYVKTKSMSFNPIAFKTPMQPVVTSLVHAKISSCHNIASHLNKFTETIIKSCRMLLF